MVLRKHDIPVQSPPAKTGIGSVKALVLALLVLTAGAVLVLGLDGEDSYAAVDDTFTATNDEGIDIEYRILTEGTGTENGTVQVGTGGYWDAAVDKAVTSVMVPSMVVYNGKTYNVTYVGDYAFSGCSSLTSVTIPDTVNYIGRGVFYGCQSLTTVTVNEGNGDYVSENGVLFNKDMTELVWYPIGGGDFYIIPDTVTSIGWGAFYRCSSLTSITIPDGVTTIGYEAFYGCSSLTSVIIPDSVASISLNAFYDVCVTDKVLPGDIIGHVYGYEAKFEWSDDLTSCKIALTCENYSHHSRVIDATVFVNGDVIVAHSGYFGKEYTGLIMGDVKYSLVNTAEPYAIVEGLVDRGVFGLSIPSEIEYDGVIYSVTSIGDYAFSGCSSLTSVTIPNGVTFIGADAFSGCSSLTSVTIPNGVTFIGADAFSRCSSLTSVTIPDSVTTIGGYAFYGCSSLTSVTIPDSVTTIGGCAFESCSALENVNIPGSLTDIDWYVFSGCQSLTSVTISDGVTFIGWGMFEGCSSLTSVIIPETMALIEGCAFRDCSSLTSVTIPDSVTSIGEEAFCGCLSLTMIIVSDGNNDYVSEDGVLFNKDMTELICYPAGSEDFYVMPDAVTSIGDYAFYGCSSLESVTMSDAVTSIGDYAFSECSSLISVTIPDTVTYIGTDAFSGCSSLTSVTIPDSVTTIEHSTFRNCSSLTSVTIPGGVAVIGYSVFSGCSSLISVTIPDTVTYIGTDAFSGCSSLTSVTIPGGVTTIEHSTFRNCSSLISVTIPEGVIIIEEYAFFGCSSLTSVIISDSVTTIERYAFSGCTLLTSVTIPNVTTIGDYAFSGVCNGDKAAPGTTVGHVLDEVLESGTCVNGGLRAHYACGTCRALFEKRDGVLIRTYESRLANHEMTLHPKEVACTEPGHEAYYQCNTCGKHFEDLEGSREITSLEVWISEGGDGYIPAGHIMIRIDGRDPTCTESGHEVYYGCSTCNEYFEDAEGNSIADPDIWISEGGDGYMPVLGHDERATLMSGQSPTCTTPGWAEYYGCDRCGQLFEDESYTRGIDDIDAWKSEGGNGYIPAFGHDMTSIGLEATCTESGYRTYFGCDICGRYFEDAEGITEIADPESWKSEGGDGYIPELGHSMGDMLSQNATCTTPGWDCYIGCQRAGCGYCIDMDGNEIADLESWKVGDGYIPAFGHSMCASWLDATCTEPGFVGHYDCSMCGMCFEDLEGNIAIPDIDDWISEGGDGYIPAFGHDMHDVEGQSADCTTAGYKGYRECRRDCCGYCIDTDGNKIIDLESWKSEGGAGYIPAFGHNIEEMPGQDATCTEPGHRTYFRCHVCGTCFEDPEGSITIPSIDVWISEEGAGYIPDGHTMIKIKGKDATCTESGYRGYYLCDTCDKYFEDIEGMTEISDPDIWISEGGAGYTSAGHMMDEMYGKDATCTESGYRTYFGCDICGRYFEDAEGMTEISDPDIWISEGGAGYIPVSGHFMCASWLDATCTEPGFAGYYGCDRCGICFEDLEGNIPIPDIDDWISDGGDGYIPAFGHDMHDVEGQSADCTTAGYKGYRGCQRDYCGYCTDADGNEIADMGSWRSEGGAGYIPALGHDMHDVEGQSADCTTAGYEGYKKCQRNYCGYCTDADGNEIADMGSWRSEGGAGYIPALGHIMAEMKGNEVTCTESGYRTYFGCDICGRYFEDIEGITEIINLQSWKSEGGAGYIPALGHDERATLMPGESPTCTEPGWAEYYGCDRCGQLFEDDGYTRNIDDIDAWKSEGGNGYIPALGHDMTSIGLEATCTEPGYKVYYQCSSCNEYFEDIEGITEIINLQSWKSEDGDGYIPALGHAMRLIPAKSPTCTMPGWVEYYKCTRCGLSFEDEAGTTVIGKFDGWSGYLNVRVHTFDENGACSVCGTKNGEVLTVIEGEKITVIVENGDSKSTTITQQGKDGEVVTTIVPGSDGKDKIESSANASDISMALEHMDGYDGSKTMRIDATGAIMASDDVGGLVKNGVTAVIDGGNGTVTFTPEVLEKIITGDVGIRIVEAGKEMSDEQIKVVGDRFALSLTISGADDKFGEPVPVSFEYAAGDGKAVTVYRVMADGTKVKMETSYRDGVVTFMTDSFSIYMVEETDAGPSEPVPEPDAGSPDGGSMMLFVGIGAAVAIIAAVGAFLLIRGRS